MLLSGKLLRHSGYIILWLRDRIAMFKTCDILKYGVFDRNHKI